MTPRGRKIITYKFKEEEGATLSISCDKVYYIYPTVDYARGGRTLIASGINQLQVYSKKKDVVSGTDFNYDYYSLIGFYSVVGSADPAEDNKVFCVFDVEEIKINPYAGIMYIYLK